MIFKPRYQNNINHFCILLHFCQISLSIPCIRMCHAVGNYETYKPKELKSKERKPARQNYALNTA